MRDRNAEAGTDVRRITHNEYRIALIISRSAMILDLVRPLAHHILVKFVSGTRGVGLTFVVDSDNGIVVLLESSL